jgi:transposase
VRTLHSLSGKLKAIAREHTDIDENIRLLCSIPGVSDTTAHNLLAEIGDISRFTGVKQLVAFAGLAPAERQSGSSVRGKAMLNKRGSRRLRKSLYMPAVVASMHNPDVKELYRRMKAAGKNSMCAMVACMRKLLHIAYGVLKNRTPYKPQTAV